MKHMMRRAIRLAKKSNPSPNPRVGAILEKNGQVIGSGWHKRAGGPHAEIEAIENSSEDVSGATLYVTMEPCSHLCKRTPPCTRAIIDNGIGRVVYGMDDPNPLVNGREVLERAGIIVEGPVAKQECWSINKQFFKSQKKPVVTIKMAMSIDGRIASESGDSKWISSEESRKLVHRLRSSHDAVMVGAGTVRADDPRLTSRIRGGKNPLRIIVGNDIPPDSRVLKNKDNQTIIVTTEENKENFGEVDVIRRKKIDFSSLIPELGKAGIKSILVEGGPSLNASLLEAGVAERMLVFVSPKILGSGPGLFSDLGIRTVSNARKIKIKNGKKSGDDLLIECEL
jgi:diaminohydroxyphosphoribosylaminopyrimidine deaminase/5-amino-6-(5-phosphoribosylamino)uracil reductase